MSELRRAARVRRTELRRRREVVEVADWARKDDDGRPRKLGPREYIGTGVTRVGRFRDVDPLRTGKVWRRNHWIAFGMWVATAGGTGFLAWRRVYGGTDED